MFEGAFRHWEAVNIAFLGQAAVGSVVKYGMLAIYF